MITVDIPSFPIHLDSFKLKDWKNLGQEGYDKIENDVIEYFNNHDSIDSKQGSRILEICAKHSLDRAIDKFIEKDYDFDLNIDLLYQCCAWRNDKAVDHFLHKYKTSNKLIFGTCSGCKFDLFENTDSYLMVYPVGGECSILELLMEDKYYFDEEDESYFFPEETMKIIDVFVKYGYSPHHIYSFIGDRDQTPRLAVIDHDYNEFCKLLSKTYPLTSEILMTITVPGYFNINITDRIDNITHITLVGMCYSEYDEYDENKIQLEKGHIVELDFPLRYNVHDKFKIRYRSHNVNWVERITTLLKK